MPRMVTVGVLALDNIRTPHGEVRNALGGSATFSSLAASFFSEVGLVSIVGEDFPEEYLELLRMRNICLMGLTRRGKTFRWAGYYEGDMNSAITVRTELNSFRDFNPLLPREYREAEYLFLANMDPLLQIRVIEQMENPKLIALDTMNYWIDNKPRELVRAISKSNVFLLNDREAKMLFRTMDLDEAAMLALGLGPRAVVIKRGSEGSSLYTEKGRYDLPAFKLDRVVDPTGAGDTFAGGLVGYLAKSGNLSEDNLRRAIAYGTVLASFTVQGFSLDSLKTLKINDVKKRMEALK